MDVGFTWVFVVLKSLSVLDDIQGLMEPKSVYSNSTIKRCNKTKGDFGPSAYQNFLPYRSVTREATYDLKTSNLKSWKDIPGPPAYPLVGCIFSFMPRSQYYKFQKYGPIVKLEGIIGTPPLIFIYEPENMELILRSEDRMPERPGFQSLEYFRKKYNNSNPEKSTGLLSEHGEKWKNFRSVVNPVMLQPKTIKLYNTPIDEVAFDMIKRMRSLRNDKHVITEPLDMEFNKWALESIGVVALGGRIGCLRPDLPPDSPAYRLITCVNDAFRVAHELDFKSSLWRFFSTPTFKRAMNIYQNQIDITREFILNGRKKILKEKVDTLTEHKGVLEKLLEIDEDVAVTMASDILVTGVDTMTNAMIAALYLLGRNLDKQAKLREEIMSKDERRPYLKACIKESMRLLPIARSTLRRTTKEYNISGYLIPKGMMVVLYHSLASRQESQFERANEFIPERWIHKSEEAERSRAHPLATSPFGFGARSCIGRRIAELEMETFLSRIIENFHVEWFGPPLRQEIRAITYMVGPYNFVFKDVKEFE